MKIVVFGSWAPSLIKFRGPLIDAMVARGHEVLAMAPDGDAHLSDELARRGARYLPISLERSGINPLRDLTAVAALVGVFRRERPDLVLAYTIKPVLYGTLASALAGVPRRAVMITGLGYAFSVPRDVKGRIVGTVAQHMYRAAFARAGTILFQNADDRDELQRRGLVPTSARVALVRGSGVDLEEYPLHPLPPAPTSFLFVGRLLRDKGIFELVDAARRLRARHPEVRVRLAGWIDSNPESVREAQLDAWRAEGVV